MDIFERINSELKNAMKSRNELELSVLRLIRSALKNKEIEISHKLSAEEAQSVIKSMIRQGKDALMDFNSAGRTDLSERQIRELQILESFLPPQITDEELVSICKQAIEQSGAKTQADIGKAIGLAMKLAAGRADGSKVRELVQNFLSS